MVVFVRNMAILRINHNSTEDIFEDERLAAKSKFD